MDLINAVNTAKKGDNAGFTYLYESTYQKSYYVALKFLKNEQLAMDVLQDSYIKAFKSLDQLVDASKFESWFNRIVATRSLNELKKNNPLLFSEMESDGEDNSNIVDFEDDRVEARPDLAIDQQETSRLVKEMMADLSDEQRMCITMFYMEEMSVKEIAEVLGVSENTVKSRLNYGRNKIKDKVLELEKKGTKLYGVLPFVFFLTLFKKDALACEVVVPTIETVLGANTTVTTQTAASTGSAGVNSTATAATVAKAGFSIAGITLSAKALVASVAAVCVVSGGTIYGINTARTSKSVDEETTFESVQDVNIQTEDTSITENNEEDNTINQYEFPDGAIPIVPNTRAELFGFKNIEELSDGSYVMNVEQVYYFEDYFTISQEDIDNLKQAEFFKFNYGLYNENELNMYCYNVDTDYFYFISDYEYEDYIEGNYSLEDMEENFICYRIPKISDDDKYLFELYEGEWYANGILSIYDDASIVIRPDANIVVDKFDSETFDSTEINCNMSEFYSEEYKSWVDSLNDYTLALLSFEVSGSEDGRASELVRFYNAE